MILPMYLQVTVACSRYNACCVGCTFGVFPYDGGWRVSFSRAVQSHSLPVDPVLILRLYHKLRGNCTHTHTHTPVNNFPNYFYLYTFFSVQIKLHRDHFNKGFTVISFENLYTSWINLNV